jgi:predicted transcriptional regulator
MGPVVPWRNIVGKIAVRVADDQRRELKRLAEQTQFSRSDLIRIAINKLLENPEWLPGWATERSGRMEAR